MTPTRIARTITALAATLAAPAFAAAAADATSPEPFGSARRIAVAMETATIVVLIGLAAQGGRTANRRTVEA
jgi:hypothetical protein